jgi:hypothetical protein
MKTDYDVITFGVDEYRKCAPEKRAEVKKLLIDNLKTHSVQIGFSDNKVDRYPLGTATLITLAAIESALNNPNAVAIIANRGGLKD